MKDIDKTISELLHEHGVASILQALLSACDAAADFSNLSNDKKLEDYWRSSAVSIFDAIKKISDKPKSVRWIKKPQS